MTSTSIKYDFMFALLRAGRASTTRDIWARTFRRLNKLSRTRRAFGTDSRASAWRTRNADMAHSVDLRACVGSARGLRAASSRLFTNRLRAGAAQTSPPCCCGLERRQTSYAFRFACTTLGVPAFENTRRTIRIYEVEVAARSRFGTGTAHRCRDVPICSAQQEPQPEVECNTSKSIAHPRKSPQGATQRAGSAWSHPRRESRTDLLDVAGL